MTGRVVSLVAIPLSLIGHVLFWIGSAGLLLGSGRGAAAEPGAVLAVSAGILLIAAAVATVAIGSAGVIVIGAAQLLFSLVLFLAPFSLRGGFSPAFEVMNAVRSVGVEIGDGLYLYVPTGFAFLTGVIMLVAGLVARRRLRPPPIELRIGAAVAGVLAVVGVMMAVAGGMRLYTRLMVTFAGLDQFGLIVLMVGSVLAGAAVLIGRWTSTAALVSGTVTTVIGLVGLASPSTVFLAAADWPDLRRGLEIAAPSGLLLLVGVLLVVAGLALRVRARRDAGSPTSTGPVGTPGEEPPPPTTAPSV
jgi:hypothetical protein